MSKLGINRHTFVREVAKKSKVNIPIVDKVLDAYMEVIKEHLVAGEKLSLHDLGIFEVKERAEKSGFSPYDQKKITIPAKRLPTYKFPARIRRVVNGEPEKIEYDSWI